MTIKKFQDFNIAETIFERKGQSKQNTPTETDTDYRDNINIPKQDTGDDSAGMYNIFLTQVRTVINNMGSNLAKINPEKGNMVSNRLIAVTGNLKPTYDSHRAMWDEIVKLSNFLGGDSKRGELSSLNAADPKGQVTDEFKIKMEELEKKKRSKSITDEKYEEDAKNLRREAAKQMDKSRGLYYLKIGQALDYWMQAVKVYKQGAIVSLQNMESEAEENETGKNYLNVITVSAKNILGSK
jgi:hypothetical protein